MNKSLFLGTFIYRYSVRCILNVYQRIQISVDMTLALKAHFSQNINPHLTIVESLNLCLHDRISLSCNMHHLWYVFSWFSQVLSS